MLNITVRTLIVFLFYVPYAYSTNMNGLCEKFIDGKEYEKGIKICNKELEAGSIKAAEKLGIMFYRGPEEYRDQKRGFELLLSASKSGNVNSMIELSNIYLFGINGVPIDLEKSFYWNKKAAISGSAIALANMGFLFLNKKYKGVKLNMAYLHFSLAKERGYSNEVIEKIMSELEAIHTKEDLAFISKYINRFREAYKKSL